MLIDLQVLLSVSAPSEKGEGAKRSRSAAEEGRKEGVMVVIKGWEGKDRRGKGKGRKSMEENWLEKGRK